MSLFCNYCGSPKKRTKCPKCGGSSDRVVIESYENEHPFRKDAIINGIIGIVFLFVLSIPFVLIIKYEKFEPEQQSQFHTERETIKQVTLLYNEQNKQLEMQTKFLREQLKEAEKNHKKIIIY